MATITRNVAKRLGHECSGIPTLFCQSFDHVLEKYVAIARGASIAVGPVQLKLTVGIFMVTLIRPPAQLFHIVH